jgi:hypothetical protein
MRKTWKKYLIGASLAASISAIATTPAHAGSITNITIGGTKPNDYSVYDANATNTFQVDNTLANVQKVLDGDATHPTGNVELAVSSKQSGFDFTKSNTSLTGKIDGRDITLSSLTSADWTPSFTNTWLSQGLAANGFNLSPTLVSFVSNIFTQYGGPQRFSDPNISYVNEDDSTGLIKIGLAGHWNANSLLIASINGYLASQQVGSSNWSIAQTLLGTLGSKQIQASEVVKVSYNGGPSQLLYSFSATKSGLVAADDHESHSGNYELTLQGLPATQPASTPEPSIMFGIIGLCGALAAQRHLKRA